MSGFDLYPQAWALYIVLGIVLLYLLDLKLKKRTFNTRVILLSFVAVLAFTPATVMDSNSLAPLVLTALLNAETHGIKEIYKGLVKLFIIWGLVIAVILAFKHLLVNKRLARAGKSSKSTVNQDSGGKQSQGVKQ